MFYSYLPKNPEPTETLQVGARAPEFSLEAANRDGILTLSFLETRLAGSGVPAGNLVTKLRRAHDSGRVQQGTDCAITGRTSFYRCREARWSIQADEIPGEEAYFVSVPAG